MGTWEPRQACGIGSIYERTRVLNKQWDLFGNGSRLVPFTAKGQARLHVDSASSSS